MNRTIESQQAKPPERGKYLVIEGRDGVGKTTQVKMLAGWLAVQGIESRTDIREPGGTPIGEAIRTTLKDPELEREPETNLYLFNAARIELQKQVIAPELDAGKWVICDRNRLSSHVYQGHGEGLDLQYVRDECRRATTHATPDLELIIHLEEGERRRRISSDTTRSKDYFENMDEGVLVRIMNGYLQEAEDLNIPLIDGGGSPDEVHQRIVSEVEKMM